MSNADNHDAEPVTVAPIVGMRYYVNKLSGSHLASVVDAKTGRVMKSFNVLKGDGRKNGWSLAETMCAAMNNANTPEHRQEEAT